MKTEMPTDVRPRFWDRSKRKYQITYPDGTTDIWENITISQCLTKYNNLSPYDNGLQLLEILEDEKTKK